MHKRMDNYVENGVMKGYIPVLWLTIPVQLWKRDPNMILVIQQGFASSLVCCTAGVLNFQERKSGQICLTGLASPAHSHLKHRVRFYVHMSHCLNS